MTRPADLDLLGQAPREQASWPDRWLDKWYRQRPGWINGTEEFHALCARHITRGSEILEIGCGPGNRTSEFLATTLGRTHGLDPDPAAQANPFLQSCRRLTGPVYPFPDGTFDAAVSDYVVEHIAQPAEHLREVLRVLRPGSVYVLRTPNLWHYVAIVSALTPHWFHVMVANRLRRLPVDSREPYPTFYRMNAAHTIRRLANEIGFNVRSISMIEKEPSYAVLSRALFVAALTYERVVNRCDVFAPFRANIFAVLEKPSSSEASPSEPQDGLYRAR